MPAIENQQTSLLTFLSINQSEITDGGRTYTMTRSNEVSDLETASGRIKRFYKNSKMIMNLSFFYLSQSSDKTVDGKQGRDYIYNLAMNNPNVFIEYKDQPDLPIKSFYGFISSYRETIIKRDLNTQCIYYNVEFSIEEK